MKGNNHINIFPMKTVKLFLLLFFTFTIYFSMSQDFRVNPNFNTESDCKYDKVQDTIKQVKKPSVDFFNSVKSSQKLNSKHQIILSKRFPFWSFPDITDTLSGLFIVKWITKIQNTYKLNGNKLDTIETYIITIELENENEKTYKLILFDESETVYSKFEIGSRHNLILKSVFDGDLYGAQLEYFACIVIKKYLLIDFQMSFMNLYLCLNCKLVPWGFKQFDSLNLKNRII